MYPTGASLLLRILFHLRIQDLNPFFKSYYFYKKLVFLQSGCKIQIVILNVPIRKSGYMAPKKTVSTTGHKFPTLELTVNVNVVDILTVRQEQQLGQVIEDHTNAVVVETIKETKNASLK
jgi:hypothetical protein